VLSAEAIRDALRLLFLPEPFQVALQIAALGHAQLLRIAQVQIQQSRGLLYASFKHGHGEREHGGRRFTDLDEAGLTALLALVPALSLLETLTTADRRPGRAAERWLNTLLRRTTLNPPA
jgi:hypothetical protein